ncbi:gliding motility-associated C-terminal domain-containing protein [Salegentibacter sediminis]|uniref:gliding motility-associated C-terminal domain-containing protein n=1 Tax=Salegentibacter sediminis TaxID=1930251 RepID=UPI0009BF033E|nr:gliding motility-associated C-terminal domain-containing protein [Salegentibacter sediminis]
MQNFTFGREGTNWFLFAFIMLIGTLPSFGQDCATVTDEDNVEPGNQQTLCYLSTVADIQYSGGTDPAIFQTDDSVNDTQPIPDDEILATDTYYVGSTSENCDRVAVEVTVNSQDRPLNLITNSRVSGFEFTTCASEGFSAGDLEGLFVNDTGYDLEVYESEFGETPYTGPLTAGESYFVGQVYTSTTGSGCPSLRTAVRFNPTSIEGPTATSPQALCEGATVADLEATGTYENTQAIRWYRSLNANEPLSENTELINGQTYYAAQVVNDSDSPLPPCETPSGLDSEDNPFRTPVTVTVITFDAGPDSLGNTICKADLDARIDDPSETANEILLSFIDEIDFEYENVSFDPTPQEIYNDYQGDFYQTFTTTATFVTQEGCEDDIVIEFEVLESYDAGEDNTEGNEVCLSTDVTEQEVEDYLTSLLSEDVDEGTFSNITQITGDIQDGSEGPFNSTYTAGTGSCSDTAEFEFTVLESPNLQQYALESGVTDVPLCNAEIPGLVNSVPQDVIDLYMELIPGAPTGGTFTNMTINEIVSAYNQNNFQTFETTYTVALDNGCSDSIVLSYTIIEGETANAGSFDNIEDFCTNEEPIELTSLTNTDSNATEGGTFSGTGVSENMFDPSTAGPGTHDITYTVDESIFCVEGSEETTFTIEVIQGPNAGVDIEESICISEVATFVENYNPQNPEATLLEVFEYFNWDGDIDGTFNPDVNILAGQLAAYYGNTERGPSLLLEGTYTVGDPQDFCGTDVSNFSITINDTQDANAGTIPNQEVCVGDEMVDLNDFLIGTDAMTGGTFTGQGVEGNMFDPSIGVNEEDGYTITYTVNDSADCVTEGDSDFTTFQIFVLEGRELGDPITASLCVSDLQPTYNLSTITNYFASLIPNYSSNGTFEPSMEEIRDQYNNAESKIGEYQTTYTLGTGDCEDSVLVTVNVQGEIKAEAGDDFSTTFCSNEEDKNLFSFLSDDANPDGYFEGYEDGNFSPSELGAGTYNFNYVVDPSNACVEDTDTAAFSIEVFEAPFAGDDFSETLCITEAAEMIEDPQAAIDWFNSIVDVEGVDQDGDFDPALLSLAADVYAYVQAPDSPSATFETTYTVTNENCADSATISLTINNLEEAEAGEDVELTFCVSQGDFDLRDYLSEDANPNGYFEDFDGTINTSELGEGVFTYTYVVDETVDCVTGDESVEFTVNIIGDLNAGADKSTSICNANIENGMFPNSTSVRDYYLNMLDEGVSRDGTFSPSIQELVNWYNNESEIGDFTTTYTISEGECSDSAELTVTVYESIPAEIDPIDDVTLCSIDDDQDLFFFLPEGADTNGYFEGYEDGMFSPSTTGAGEFEVTYTLDETSPCVTGEASATFTITVLETVTAGEDMTANFCTTDGEQDLYNFLAAEASAEGEFTYNDEVLVDGMFDASAMGAGSYDVTYTVEPINECGVATSTLTITVNEVPDAPAAPELDAFCAIEMATGADLPMAEGQTWYADDELTTMVMDEDMLVDGAYYLTVTSENGCESEATEVTVTVNDSPAPTISSTNLEFCDADNPTIADLNAEIVESGEITWYDSEDGTNALGTSTTLTSGTYYATLTGETGCESTERLVVTVSVENCPIVYPEIITPNNDAKNDTFIIKNITNEYPNYSIEIFNRWGNVIYKGNASTPAWDGTSNQSGSFGDDVLPVGVYFYVIDFNDGSTEPKQGKVYLSR